MTADIDTQIDALFEQELPPDDPTGCLVQIQRILSRFEPVRVWLGDAQGRIIALHCRAGEPVTEQVAAQVRSLCRPAAQCTAPSVAPADDGRFLLTVPASPGQQVTATLSALVARAEADGQTLEQMLPVLGCCAGLSMSAMAAADEARDAEVRVSQLIAEQDVLKNSYTQIMASALEEREQRLSDQRRYTEKLEEEVAARSVDLRDALQRAEQANKSKSEFLANMSHEIRTPMTAILGYTDLLIAENTDQKDNVEKLATIRRNGDHLLAIINDILDLSKIEAGKMQIERIDVSPAQIISDVAELQTPRASDRGLRLDVQFATPVPARIQTDPTRLRQILHNLVGNAIKFTKKGGVSIVASLVPGPEASAAPCLCLKVVDTGIGLSEQQQRAIFEAFSQADTSTTRKFGGTGLGLTISRRLARMLGGDITVQGEAGKGSTFTLTVQTGAIDGVPMIDGLSKSAAAAPTNAARAEAAKQPLAGLSILVAEDGPDNQRLITTILKRKGAQVALAENGRVAYEHATAAIADGNPFDVIFMDMQMPEMDGYTASSKLRAEGYKRPIIALTAHAMSSDRQKCIDAGCDDYATKPIDLKGLVALAEKYGRGPDSAAAAPTSTPAEASPPAKASPPAPKQAELAAALAAGAVAGVDHQVRRVAEAFARSLPQRAQVIQEALRRNDLAALRQAAAGLLNEAPGDLASRVADLSAELERCLLAETDPQTIKQTVEQLIDLCWRAVGGPP